MNNINSLIAFLAIVPFGCKAIPCSANESRPNVLVVLADDLGYADLGVQNSPDIRTPRIDSIAANGVRCTAGYVTAPQCSPSRGGLICGRYQQRFGHEGNPNFPLTLLNCGPTIASLMRDGGYATAHFGKWHLGWNSAEEAPEEHRNRGKQCLPTQHGFDESFGYHEYKLVARKGTDILPSLHAYDDRVFARKAADFISRREDQPWFIYLALHAPHLQYVDFGGFGDQFLDTPENRKPVLSVMAQQDAAVGIVLDQLKKQRLKDNTLVVYLSDNGGTRTADMVKGKDKHWRGSLNLPFSGKKGSSLEGGIRTPILMQWKGRLTPGMVYDRPVSSLDILPTALAACRIALPKEIAFDGVNLLPFLEGGQNHDPHEALFWRWRAEQAIRRGDWKLVRGKANKAWRLIDISTDLTEAKDVSDDHPEIKNELRTRWERWNATLKPVGPSFKDTTEGDDRSTTVRKAGNQKTSRHSPVPTGPAAVAAYALKLVDKDGDQNLTLEEFLPLDVQARHHGEDHFNRGDVNADGFLDAKELATELAAKQTWFVILAEGIASCFSRIDTDDDGKLDVLEYREVSRMGGHAEQHFKGADDDNDGFLDLAEFSRHATSRLDRAYRKAD